MEILKPNTLLLTYMTFSLIFFSKQARGLECYQCQSVKDGNCPEYFKEGYHAGAPNTMVPASCDHVFEARYCVKTTGMFGGELGTKRFCSARDWGNYCEWVRRPGDEREYRACVFTCWGNSCNAAHSLTPAFVFLSIPAIISSLYYMILYRL